MASFSLEFSNFTTRTNEGAVTLAEIFAYLGFFQEFYSVMKKIVLKNDKTIFLVNFSRENNKKKISGPSPEIKTKKKTFRGFLDVKRKKNFFGQFFRGRAKDFFLSNFLRKNEKKIISGQLCRRKMRKEFFGAIFRENTGKKFLLVIV